MKQSTLELLCCPFCKSALSLKSDDPYSTINNGEIHCSGCSRRYPIRDGIAEMIKPEDIEGPNQRFARYYNRLAPFYSLFIKFAFLPFGGERKARQEILKHLNLDGGRTLEVSIGNGVNLPYLFESPKAGEIFGMDISIGQLTQCRKLTSKRKWEVDLFLAMAEALPFRDEIFDNVLHIGGINFFTDKRKSIEEMMRVARPGGKIVIADEAERLAKPINRSHQTSSIERRDAALETPIQTLVPDTVQEVRRHGIWRFHGKYHGYCLDFSKPKNLSGRSSG